MIRRIFVFDHVSNLVASCILFEKLLRQLPRTNLPCEKTSLQELPASNIALHAGVVGFDLCAGRLGRLQVQRRKNC